MLLLLTAWDQSPPRTNFLKVAAVGWSSLHPASCIRTSALVLSPMLVRCWPMSRTISWSVDDRWVRRFTFRTSDDVTLDSSDDVASFSSSLPTTAGSPPPSSKEAPLLELLCRVLLFCSLIFRLLLPPLAGGDSSRLSTASSLIMLEADERVFAPPLTVAAPELLRWLLTRFLGGDCEVDMRGGPEARVPADAAASRWRSGAGTKPHRSVQQEQKNGAEDDVVRKKGRLHPVLALFFCLLFHLFLSLFPHRASAFLLS